MTEQAAIFRGPRSDEYETPGWIFDPLHAQYRFTVDLNANASNAKVPQHFSADRSFLGCDGYLGCGWMNPAFSLAEPMFCKLDALASRGCKAVAIYKSSNMETGAWSYIFARCSWIAQPRQRVNYLVDGVEKKGVQFASAVIGWNVDPPRVPWPHVLLEVIHGR